MAAHNIDMFEKGNYSNSHIETTNSNTTTHFTRSPQIVVALLPASWSTSPVDDEINSNLEEILTDQNGINSQDQHCESRCLHLKFSHEVAPVVFTGECIFPKGTKLELVDAVTGQQVRHGPLASAQVVIFVLNDNELNSHIMMQTRDGTSRRDQNPYLRLEGGVVSVNEMKFRYTPKHMKKNVVKLGARIVDPSEVIEAVTGPFTVKDKRLKSKKRYPPLPTDDVWRLEHIYKDGPFHNRLTENGIKTVEDFLIELQNNPQRLRHILGKSMSENYWKKVTTHAKTCNLDGRKNLYHPLETEHKLTVNEWQSLELQNTSGAAESNQWVESAECSTSYAIADRQSESDEMSVVITSTGHSGLGTLGYLESPRSMTSVIAESEYWEKIMQFLDS